MNSPTPIGSAGLTMRCFYHTLRISVPTVTDAAIGRLRAEHCDARLRDWAETLVRITRTKLAVSGHQHIPEQACIVMSNHQSLSDVPILYAALPEGLRLRMVAKEELFRVPIWGRAMRLAGFIPINRGNRARAIASLENAKLAMAGGTFIWIAPEGTRSRTGALGPLKKGGFMLAQDTGRPILPIVVSGTRHIVPTQGLKTYFDNHASVTIRPLISTTGRATEEVMAEVQRAIDPATLPHS
jgi:1-acyl-sn-glycerol-3-phosphate acyltransferase